jgi:hypothetical protein
LSDTGVKLKMEDIPEDGCDESIEEGFIKP